LTGAPWLFVAGLGAFAAAPVVWRRRRSPGEVALFADGFEDDRWPEAGRIAWGDVVALDPDFATGDLALALTAEAAERLAGLPDRPRRSLAWEGGRPGGRPVYRLPVGSGLMGVYQAAEVRSGFSLNCRRGRAAPTVRTQGLLPPGYTRGPPRYTRGPRSGVGRAPGGVARLEVGAYLGGYPSSP